MPIFLGIDGGGSKTTCVIGDETRVLGSATGRGANVGRVGRHEARASILRAIHRACESANLASAEILRTCIGLAGISVPDVAAIARDAVKEAVAGEIIVVGDMEIALEAAFGGSTGLVVIAGTGSIAYGRNEHGITARAGGHGATSSDEGSGHWIGRTAVYQFLSSNPDALAQRRRGALLSTAVGIVLGARSLEHLEQVAVASPAPNFAELFPEVCATAQAGDEVAQEILVRAGHELAKLADDVLGKLWRGDQLVRVALVGGVFKHSPIVRRSFCRALRELRQNVTISLRVVDPAMGALALARKGVCEQAHT